MPYFKSDDYTISYLDEGEGEPVLLIHGFASNKMVNWVNPGWVQTLTKAGYHVIAVDNRGHGESEKLYDSALYSSPIMAEDARALLDHLGLQKAFVMGYSMGARISAFLGAQISRAGQEGCFRWPGWRHDQWHRRSAAHY